MPYPVLEACTTAADSVDSSFPVVDDGMLCEDTIFMFVWDELVVTDVSRETSGGFKVCFVRLLWKLCSLDKAPCIVGGGGGSLLLSLVLPAAGGTPAPRFGWFGGGGFFLFVSWAAGAAAAAVDDDDGSMRSGVIAVKSSTSVQTLSHTCSRAAFRFSATSSFRFSSAFARLKAALLVQS